MNLSGDSADWKDYPDPGIVEFGFHLTSETAIVFVRGGQSMPILGQTVSTVADSCIQLADAAMTNLSSQTFFPKCRSRI